MTSQYPIGEPSSEPRLYTSLNGVWFFEESAEVYMIRTTGEGRFVFADVEWEDDRLQVTNTEGVLTSLEGEHYLNLDLRAFEEDSDTPQGYLFARVLAYGDGTIVLAAPNAEAFAKAIDNDRLLGTVTKGDHGSIQVEIVSESASLNKFIDADLLGEQFELDQLIILRRAVTNN